MNRRLRMFLIGVGLLVGLLSLVALGSLLLPKPQITPKPSHQTALATGQYRLLKVEEVTSLGFKLGGQPTAVRKFLVDPGKQINQAEYAKDWYNNNTLAPYVKPGSGLILWVNHVSEVGKSEVRAVSSAGQPSIFCEEPLYKDGPIEQYLKALETLVTTASKVTATEATFYDLPGGNVQTLCLNVAHVA